MLDILEVRTPLAMATWGKLSDTATNTCRSTSSSDSSAGGRFSATKSRSSCLKKAKVSQDLT